MLGLLEKLFGSANERKIRKIEHIVDEVGSFEEGLRHYSDDELRAKTAFFKQELQNRPRETDAQDDAKAEQELLDTILPEAFAVCREASRRVLGMRHYDVQLIGGYVLHKGNIAEMRTGEGKTLVATLPVYLNALTGKGVHVVTVNDYLAKRDSEWMGQLYRFLGLSVDCVLSSNTGFQPPFIKKQAYAADITYGTNNEFGFDYLKDNMATSLDAMVQRPFHYAVIDEVDSILIDEARTPLIISGKLEQSAETYHTMAKLAPLFELDTHFTADSKTKNVILTDAGLDQAASLLGINDLFTEDLSLAHHLLSALKARHLYKKDVDYVVQNDQVIIVDEFTGRLMDGRRWSDGLHQAVEAKEQVTIQDETQTLASITFQNLFRLYPKLSGMTGTAMTEESEFSKIYDLDVTAIPTNREDVRQDLPDQIFRSEAVKYLKVAESIALRHREGRPVLVGTTTIEQSEYVSHLISDVTPHIDYLQGKAERFYAVLLAHKRQEVKDALMPVLKDLNTLTYDAWQAALAPFKASLENAYETAKWLENMEGSVVAVEEIRKGISHHVLNAKHHAQEASIVAQAGRLGAVTIATNMAGRGTDILLGGNPDAMVRDELTAQELDWQSLSEEEFKAKVETRKPITDAERQAVLDLGGLYIIGSERHESRRIDNQLRGRAGRQGDPGTTQFFLSLEDSLLRLFPSQMVVNAMTAMNFEESIPLSDKFLSRSLEVAQKKVEAYHFDMRKNVLQYDDVLTEQRKLIYSQRKKVLELDGLRSSLLHMLDRVMERSVTSVITPEFVAGGQDTDTQRVLQDIYQSALELVPNLRNTLAVEELHQKEYPELIALLQAKAKGLYQDLETQLGHLMQQLRLQHGIQFEGQDAVQRVNWAELGLSEADIAERFHPLRQMERDIILQVVDARWVDYLHNLDMLRDGIGLRAYGQKDPLVEYKREAFELFQRLMWQIQNEVVSLFFKSKIQIDIPVTEGFDAEAFAQSQGMQKVFAEMEGGASHEENILPLPEESQA
ncbi:MAG: preprotein translocase subunit SecA [Vampirovibrio sp.]